MSGCLVFLSFAVLFCKVNSQLCSPPILPPPCPAPCVPISCPPTIPPCPVSGPQVINPNPYVTTIIDTTVSNALVNALQLLIVSNLIGATVAPSSPVVNNLGPLLETLICANPCPVEAVIPEYVTYGATYDLIPPYLPISTCGPYYDLIPPYNPNPTCGPYYDVVPPCNSIPTCGPYYDLIPPCGPSYELIPPCAPIIDPYLPPLCGIPDILTPNYITYTETIAPICIDSFPYNGYNELIFPVCGLETIAPNFCGGLTEIIPNYINYPIPEICPSLNPYYGGFAETITPAVGALPFGCLNEVIPPCVPPLGNIYPEPFGLAVAPNYYGGFPELSGPLAAEVVFPSTIPTPLGCNYGYSPSSLPCVRVEPVAYDNCVYNGYGGPIYY